MSAAEGAPLAGKVVFISGGSRGIGKAIALKAAAVQHMLCANASIAEGAACSVTVISSQSLPIARRKRRREGGSRGPRPDRGPARRSARSWRSTT